MKDTTPKKFTVEYFDDNKKLTARWHYDHSITKNGPVLTEDFDPVQPETSSRKQKKVGSKSNS